LLCRIMSSFNKTCTRQLADLLFQRPTIRRGVDRTSFERPPMSPQPHCMCSVDPIHQRVEEKQQFHFLLYRLLLAHQLPALLAISIVIDRLIPYHVPYGQQ
jgi:hypothetical protein